MHQTYRGSVLNGRSLRCLELFYSFLTVHLSLVPSLARTVLPVSIPRIHSHGSIPLIFPTLPPLCATAYQPRLPYLLLIWLFCSLRREAIAIPFSTDSPPEYRTPPASRRRHDTRLAVRYPCPCDTDIRAGQCQTQIGKSRPLRHAHTGRTVHNASYSSPSTIHSPTDCAIAQRHACETMAVMPPCKDCHHAGLDHNWTIPPCPVCREVKEKKATCANCLKNGELGRIRGRCTVCRCRKYRPDVDLPKPLNHIIGRIRGYKRK